MIGIIYIPHKLLWDYCFKLGPIEIYYSPVFLIVCVYKRSCVTVRLFILFRRISLFGLRRFTVDTGSASGRQLTPTVPAPRHSPAACQQSNHHHMVQRGFTPRLRGAWAAHLEGWLFRTKRLFSKVLFSHKSVRVCRNFAVKFPVCVDLKNILDNVISAFGIEPLSL
jgi:hypothetical protein